MMCRQTQAHSPCEAPINIIFLPSAKRLLLTVGFVCWGPQVWPRSHVPIWNEQWRGFRQGQLHSMFRDGGAPSDHLDREDWFCGGYASPEIERIKREGAAFECCGPAGTVILWHHKLLHRAGEHHNPDCLRMATIHPFIKTPESLPDALTLDGGGDPWRDWSEAVRALPEEDERGARL
jgi:hypothetical protein